MREAMGNGGIYIVAPADEAGELTQQTAVGRAREALAECRSGASSSYCSDSATAPI